MWMLIWNVATRNTIRSIEKEKKEEKPASESE